MSHCVRCGQQIEAGWGTCPNCAAPLAQQPMASEQQHVPAQQQYMPPQPIMTAPQQQLVQYQPAPVISIPLTSSGRSGGGAIAKGLIIGVILVALLIVVSGVLYVWANNLAAGNYTWSGNIDQRAIDDGPWTWYDSDCGLYSLSTYNDNGGWSETAGCAVDFEIKSAHTVFDWPLDVTAIDGVEDGEEFEMEFHMRNAIVGDVWFTVLEYAYVDSVFWSAAELDMDGMCFASVSVDWMQSSAWRSAISSTNWPSFCDSVDSY